MSVFLGTFFFGGGGGGGGGPETECRKLGPLAIAWKADSCFVLCSSSYTEKLGDVNGDGQGRFGVLWWLRRSLSSEMWRRVGWEEVSWISEEFLASIITVVSSTMAVEVFRLNPWWWIQEVRPKRLFFYVRPHGDTYCKTDTLTRTILLLRWSK